MLLMLIVQDLLQSGRRYSPESLHADSGTEKTEKAASETDVMPTLASSSRTRYINTTLTHEQRL